MEICIGIKNINLGFIHTPMCVSTVYFLEICEQKSEAYYSGGIQTRDFCNSRAVSYKLDHLDCPEARGSLNPKFLALKGN